MTDFWIGVLGNIVASVILAVIAWFWKLRPHLQAQEAHRRAEAAHREAVMKRLDAQDKALGVTHG